MPEWARFQEWVARKLSQAGVKARARSQQHGGMGVSDVETDRFHVECKSYESKRPDIQKAILQATLDSINNPDKYPVAITKFKGEKPIVSMSFDTFANLAKELDEHGTE